MMREWTPGWFRGARFPFRGEALSLYAIARAVNMPPETLRQRVLKHGMTVEDAIACDRLRPRRKAKHYWFRGRFLSIREHAELTGIPDRTLRNRVSGSRIMEADEARAANAAFRDPPRHACLLTYAGRTMTIADWARELGISQKTLAARVGHYQWPVEKALTMPLDPIRVQVHVRRRNLRIIRRIASTFHPMTGGYAETFANPLGTGAGRHAHHLQSEKPS